MGPLGGGHVWFYREAGAERAYEAGGAELFSAVISCAFLPPHVGERYSEIIGDVQRDWQPGTKLSDQHFTALWEINKQLRSAYDASPARSFGMKHFDKQFQPMLGWDEYYSR
jgi:hypothetical protein